MVAKTFRIIITQTVDRIYEVKAKNEEEATGIYNKFDSRTRFVKEVDRPEVDTLFEIEEV